MTVESSEVSTKLQASVMADHAGIKLTGDQVDRYVEQRLGYPDVSKANTLPTDQVVHLLSDQQILDGLLDAGQRPKFRTSFPNIKFQDAEPVIKSGMQDVGTTVVKRPEPKR